MAILRLPKRTANHGQTVLEWEEIHYDVCVVIYPKYSEEEAFFYLKWHASVPAGQGSPAECGQWEIVHWGGPIGDDEMVERESEIFSLADEQVCEGFTNFCLSYRGREYWLKNQGRVRCYNGPDYENRPVHTKRGDID